MKLVTPLDSCRHYEELVEAGAGEFYCGYVPQIWLEKYGMAAPINRQSFMNGANISDFESMKILSRMKADMGIPIKITFNALHYFPEQYILIGEIIDMLLPLGFDTYILADIGLIFYLIDKRKSIKIHISGENPMLNHKAIEFFSDYNVTRIIFPRKTSISTMDACISANKNKMLNSFEAFMLNENCAYVGGYCNCFHCDEMVSGCFIPSKIRKLKEERSMNSLYRYFTFYHKKSNNILNNGLRIQKDSEIGYHFAVHGCGICAIKKLKEIGITHLKIVGRGKRHDFLKEDIVRMTKILQLADEIPDDVRFKQTAKTQLFGEECPKSNNFCYFPDESI